MMSNLLDRSIGRDSRSVVAAGVGVRVLLRRAIDRLGCPQGRIRA